MRRPTFANALILLAALTAVRVFVALRFPLAPDETYYWEWSRRLDWGYYDQGPMIAWLIRASTSLIGSAEIGVRAAILLCATLTLWLVYLTGARLFGRRAGFLAMLIGGVTPMGLAGGFIATYDVPLALGWAGAMYCMTCIALTPSEGDGSSPLWTPWLALGAVTGLGLLSKYTMALAAPCALLCLAGRSDLRHWLRRPQPYAAALLALLVLSPNLVWQAQHDWLSFAHMVGLTGKGEGTTALRRLGDFVGSQMGLMTPLLFLGMVASMWDSCRHRRDGAGGWLAFCFSAPVLILFTALALKTKVQANWAVCGWIGAAVAYAGWATTPRRVRFAWAAIGLAALVSAMAGWPELRVAMGVRVPARFDQSRKMYGGRELAAACVTELARMPAGAGRSQPVVGAATYDNASRIAFYLPDQPRAYCFFLGTRDNQYRFLNDAAGLASGANALVVDHRPPDDPLLPAFDTLFARVEPVPEPVVVRVPRIYDEPVVTYYLYRCYDYRAGDVASD